MVHKTDRSVLRLSLLTSMAASSLICLLMPLSMYDANPSESLMTAYVESLVYSAGLMAVTAGFLFLVLLLVSRFSQRLWIVPIELVYSLCAQENLIGADHGALDGSTINWPAMRTVSVVNALALSVVIIASFPFAVFIHKARRELSPSSGACLVGLDGQNE